MGGKYEIIGWCLPHEQGNDLHEYTDSLWQALKFYIKARKMYYSAFIIRNRKKENVRYDNFTGELYYERRTKSN